MKDLCFVIVALICVQTIHASTKCEKDLFNLRKEAAKFFTKFGNEHNIAHEDLVVIQTSTEMLDLAINFFESVNYGADTELNVLQCMLKQFFDIFLVVHAETDKKIKHLQGEIDPLLDIADDFYIHQNLICRSGKLTGCDAELNTLRCELSTFLKVLYKSSLQAERDLRGIDSASNKLGKYAKEFLNEYKLTCNPDEPQQQQKTKTCQCQKGNINNLKRDIKNYYNIIKQIYDIGRLPLADLTNICDNLNSAIVAWTTKLQ